MTRTSRQQSCRRSIYILGISFFLAISASPAVAQAPAAPTAAPPTPQSPQPPGPASRVEGRIADLHKKLAITQNQEPQFKSYADLMRSNAQAMEDLFHHRAQNRDTTARGVLHWYAQLTTAHADGLNKLLPAFDALYEVLSPQQKKAADAAFAPLRQGRPARKAG